ncbi:hypothetical protein B0F90DRAFT_1815277 [Multifurca ochricompacta]|uniref:Uncharacterized protein n=1 Tax=Multifurca ochricompacta TaxID=376703 RepID=A0AAD4M922_9AGAM|nr:hypothetical protein B0F90DRAFT_1815277 [Multifurca ochricompacta]
MGFFTDIFNHRDKSGSSLRQNMLEAHSEKAKEVPASTSTPSGDLEASEGVQSANPSDVSPPASDTPPVSQADGFDTAAATSASPDANRRWSFQNPFVLSRKPAPSLSNIEERDPPARATSKESALVVRSLIVGQDTDADGLAVSQVRVSRSQLSNVKAQLLKPKTANKVIAQLRVLPALSNSTSQSSTPIHAPVTERALRFSTVASATIDSIAEAFRDLHIVSLFTAPDLGLGQPGDGPGLLAGAVPTPETVINGIVQITPQLLALGFATGKAIIPDHTGVYPPTDRISVLTYWWGLELLLPHQLWTILADDRKQRAHSISSTVMNFLTTLSVMYEGVREILPFVRYFSQYIDFEFNSIKAQNLGKGVICAATWMMPVALVPRPWDFPDPPKRVEPPAMATLPDANPTITVPGPVALGQTGTPASPPLTSGAVTGPLPLPLPATHNPTPSDLVLAAGSA